MQAGLPCGLGLMITDIAQGGAHAPGYLPLTPGVWKQLCGQHMAEQTCKPLPCMQVSHGSVDSILPAVM